MQVRSVIDTLAAIHAESLRRDPNEWMPLFERPKDHVLKLLTLVKDGGKSFSFKHLQLFITERPMTAEFSKYNPPKHFRALLQKSLPHLTPRKLFNAKNKTHTKFSKFQRQRIFYFPHQTNPF